MSERGSYSSHTEDIVERMMENLEANGKLPKTEEEKFEEAAEDDQGIHEVKQMLKPKIPSGKETYH
jgi:hypothetical protein